MALRLLVFDGNPKRGETLLRSSWRTGAQLYRALGRVDRSFGATTWREALQWLTTHGGAEPLREVQFWGHGRWGKVLIGEDALCGDAWDSEHRSLLGELRARMLPDGASLLWLRTCETFGAHEGHRFATRFGRELGARVAGHTHVIGALQSGLHGLRPGASPHWDAAEGLAEGTPQAPLRALPSSPSAPNTIHFMNGRVPPEWFDDRRRRAGAVL